MIKPLIEEGQDYIDFSILTEGICFREITIKPEWKVGARISREELKDIWRAIDYFLNYEYPKERVTQEWD